MNFRTFSARCAFVLVLVGVAVETPAGIAAAASFPVASVRLEQNVTDGDLEVVFEVNGRKEGLAELTIIGPDGRQVAVFKAPDASTLGIRQFRFESPEPRDGRVLKAAYPEGVYEFVGKTVSGEKLESKATLSHRVVAAAKIVTPAANARHVPVKEFTLAWNPVKGAASYAVTIAKDETSVLTVLLPSSTTTFVAPPGMLQRKTNYSATIGAVMPEGNISSVETSFTTE